MELILILPSNSEMHKKLLVPQLKGLLGLLLFMAFFFGQYERLFDGAEGLGIMEVIDADFDIDDSEESDNIDDLLAQLSRQYSYGLKIDFGRVPKDEEVVVQLFVGVPLFISLHRLLIDC